jgi:acetoin utilization protein AcuC
MSAPAALIYDPGYLAYNFGPQHPLNPVRMQLAVALIEACGLLDEQHYIAAPPPADETTLLTVHRPGYVHLVEAAANPPPNWDEQAAAHGLGPGDTPAFPAMHAATSLIAGGSLLAAQLVLSGKVKSAFNVGGGLHHAHPDAASGFCVYNDPAVAIAYLRDQGLRVLYIDTDVHHGDGVQEIFYDDDRVLILSVHETGRYLFPGSGFVDERGQGRGYGYAVNLPLAPYTDDASYIECFDALVPAIARAYQPDIIVSQNGADGHYRDPLAHLVIGTDTYIHISRQVKSLADELCCGKLVALGGGGYDIYNAVPRIWTLLWATITEQLDSLPVRTPQPWLELVTDMVKGNAKLPLYLHDPELIDELPAADRERINAQNRAMAAQAVTGALPLIKSR